MRIINKSRGFTLVELALVIVVIGILATIVIVNYSSTAERSKELKVRAELNQLEDAIELARFNSKKTLREITQVNCTRCQDEAVYHQSLDRIGAAAGVSMEPFQDGDPWGLPYAIDENEGEYVGDPCRDHDLIYSLSRVTPQDAWNRIYPDGMLIEVSFFTTECR